MKHKIKLTTNEMCILRGVVDAVVDNLKYNKEGKDYRSNYEDWIYCLGKKDMRSLKDISEKI
jgi:hypothetical protein